MPPRIQNEDLFEDSRMSFGEHLEELRKVLIRSLIGVAIGCVAGFLLAERVVQVLQRPLENALTNYYVQIGKQQLRDEHGYVTPQWLELLDDQKMVPESVVIDPGQLIGLIREVNPDFLEASDWKPWRFVAGDFDRSRIVKMCRMWMESGKQSSETSSDSSNEAARQLWKLLTSDQQQQVSSIAKSKEASDEDAGFLADSLNRILGENAIHQSEAFRSLVAVGQKSWTDLLAAAQPDPLAEMIARLDSSSDPKLAEQINRILIGKLFGDAIAPVATRMQPITIFRSAKYQSQSLGATETFMIWVKAGVITGLLLASPWVFYQLWTFVAAGLYPTEQKYVYIFLPISLALFFSGVLLAFFFVFEPVLGFLFGFNARMGISPQPRINDWLSFVMFLPLGFGIAFQLPLVMLFLNRIELVSVEAYSSKWRIAVVAIFGLSMLLTPADPISMVMLAVPLTGLYFLGIGLCKWLNKPSNPYAAAAADGQ